MCNDDVIAVGAVYKESNYGLPVRIVDKNPRGWGKDFFIVEFVQTGARIKLYKSQLLPWNDPLPD